MPSALWYTLATAAQLPDAGPFVGGPARGVLHTTEGDSYAGALATYKASGNAPHFTVQGDHVWQHVPLDRAATALKHQPGTVETNRLSCIQIEIVGHAASPTVPPALPPLMRWIEGQLGIAKVAPKFLPYPASSGASTVRFSPNMWLRFGGWCGHQHVPNNDHGDPGAISVAALFPPTEVRPMYDPPLSVCATLKAPNGGLWGLGPDGGVYAFEGAPFYGSAAGQAYFSGRHAARLEAHPSGGYTIVATTGERYNYPAS
jgi:hypothetical protein